MRTTIELKDEYRAKLLEVAARRGEKGFSKIVEEAVAAYLKAIEANEKLRRRALSLEGALNEQQAEQLRAATAELRESWGR